MSQLVMVVVVVLVLGAFVAGLLVGKRWGTRLAADAAKVAQEAQNLKNLGKGL